MDTVTAIHDSSTLATSLNTANNVTEPAAMIARMNCDYSWRTHLPPERRVELFNIAANAFVDGNLYNAVMRFLTLANEDAKSKPPAR